jgi:hypothetical protein
MNIMETKEVTLSDSEFVQVLDGTVNGYVQLPADCWWCAASAKPDRKAVAHLVSGEKQFPAPLKIWMRSRFKEATITVTSWAAGSDE